MTGKRVTLRQWKVSDAEALYEYASDPVLARNCGWAPHANITISRLTIQTVLWTPEVYAVVLRETKRAIGCVCLKTPDAYCLGIEPDSMELGFWIGAPYQGQGFVGEAANLLLDRAFRDLHLKAVWCGYYAGNEKSRRAQEKLGFIPHHFTPNALTSRGDYADTYYSLLTLNDRIAFQLRALADEEYRRFNMRLIPGIDPDTVIGVRSPALRRIAKWIGTNAYFLQTLPHATHEENILHAIQLSAIPDRDACIEQIDRFLPYVSNWAVCDTISSACFTDGDPKLYEYARRLILSGSPYAVRFGFLILLRNFSKDAFRARHMDLIARIDTEHYYIRMAAAWYLAEAMIDHFDDVLYFIEHSCPDRTIARYAVRKAIESFRISPENKACLKSVRL